MEAVASTVAASAGSIAVYYVDEYQTRLPGMSGARRITSGRGEVDPLVPVNVAGRTVSSPARCHSAIWQYCAIKQQRTAE